jgi:predicted protein tyrosine phosphatase
MKKGEEEEGEVEKIHRVLDESYDKIGESGKMPPYNKFDLVYGPNLYVGELAAVPERQWHAVISAVSLEDYEENVKKRLGGGGDAATMHVPVKDSDKEDIARHFPQTREFIAQHISAGPVLVHCNAGMSRSATIACDYMMHANPFLGLSVERALLYLQAARPIIRPNGGFVRQLIASSSSSSK